jgi:hypothetical protein
VASTSIQLVVDGIHFVETCEVADAFANNFQIVYNSLSPAVFSSLSSPSEFLFLELYSDSDIFKVRKLLKPAQLVGHDNDLNFIITGCSDKLIPILKNVLIFSQRYFPTLRKQAAIVLVFKISQRASVSNYRATWILKNMFPKLFEFVIYGHVSHYFKFKLNPCEHGFKNPNPPPPI